MLSKLIGWFEVQTATGQDIQAQHKINLATAVLLYLPHSQFIQSKLAVLEQLEMP